MKKTFTLILIASLAVVSCKKKKQEETTPPTPAPTTGTLKINIVPKFGGAPFAFYTDYYNPLNQRLQFEVLRFFLTEFYARTTTGDSSMVHDAFKFDLGDNLTSFSFSMNPGDYSGMSFGLGVAPSLNHIDPTTYDPSHPLSYNSANTMHWSWSDGYIFMKVEGKDDNTGTGTGPLTHLFAWHTGDDHCYRTTPFLPKNFSISIGNTTTLNLDVDVAKFLTTPTDTLDLTVDSLTHYTDNPGLANRISTNAAQAFSFE